MQNDNIQKYRNAGRKKERLITLSACLLLSFALAGCSPPPAETSDGQQWQEDWTQIGSFMGIDAPEQFTLLDNKETLAADGLYYATWATGSSVPYENSDGNTVDLYDAQLYLLASEGRNEASAKKNCQTWLSSAEENYDVLTKESVTCNGQSYTLITYNCISDDTPYERGASAIGVCGARAVCAELTCVENYENDLTKLLTEFLNNCHYSKQN